MRQDSYCSCLQHELTFSTSTDLHVTFSHLEPSEPTELPCCSSLSAVWFRGTGVITCSFRTQCQRRVWVQGVNDVRGRGVYKHVYSTMCASHPESVKVMHSCRESKSDTESNVCFCPEHVSELLWDVSIYTIISVRSQS